MVLGDYMVNNDEYRRYKTKKGCLELGEFLSEIVKDRGMEEIELPGDVTAPHSELCMHVGCAGRPIIKAYGRKDVNYGYIVYIDDDGNCRYTEGKLQEILPSKIAQGFIKH